MDPKQLITDETKPKNKDDLFNMVWSYYDESCTIRNKLEHRWAKNQRLFKGIPVYAERTQRTVTKRPKMRFRKIWSSVIRLVASLYRAFLRDKTIFRIRGFDEIADWKRAKVLEIMTRYRLNWLFRRRDGFVKFIWAFLDCITPGTGVVKVHWQYNEDANIDEPCLTNYPLEQVCLDWTAPVVNEMRYACLENYLTMDQLEEMGYKNLNQIQPVELPQHTLRDIRWRESGDPLRARDTGSAGINYESGTVGNAYPALGSTEGGDSMKEHIQNRYRAVECFYKKNGKIYFCVFSPDSRIFLQDPEVSPYGTVYPIAVGSLLLEAHKLTPESLVEPLEGPQEDLNMSINLRKDNQLLAMMGGWSIDKFAGVDTQALSNVRPGFIVRRNTGIGAIEPIKLPDVTQTSYAEANADQLMIEEMSGITPVKQGQTTTDKTGVAAINLQESNAKEELYIATIGETLFRQIIYLLAYEIQLFETDERIFRVANMKLREEEKIPVINKDDVYDLEFDMDIEIDVGMGESARAVELQRQAVFTQSAIQSNQSTILALRSGIQIPNPTIVDTGRLLKKQAKELEIDDFNDLLIPVQPPAQAPGGQEAAQAAAGQAAPQPGMAPELPADFAQFLEQSR